MNHDELLEKIKREENYLKTQMYDGNAIGGFVVTNALRAVVELHEPVSIPWDEYLEDICVPCDTDYPCSTIQAIEKELS